jgi:LPS-assembly lipoprotein
VAAKRTEGASFRAALLALPLLLAACNLAPVYSGGSSGPAQTALAGVAIEPIPDQVGYLVTDRLRQRLGESRATTPYRLTVRLDDRIDGFGVRGDNSIIRERRTLRARFALTDASGRILLDETTAADSGIDVTRSEYATVAAEQTALERLSERLADQIVARLALAARQGFPAARMPTPQGVPPGTDPRPTTLGTPVDPQSNASGGPDEPSARPAIPPATDAPTFVPGAPDQPSGLPADPGPK